MNYDRLAECPQFTVVNEYVSELEVGSGAHESEAQLERKFIAILEGQGYEYLNTLTEEDDLVANLRVQMEKLNHVALREGTFTDREWGRFYREVLANPRDHVVEKTAKFKEIRRFDFEFDDHRHANLMIFDAENVNNNRLQVINQYEEHGGRHEVCYDVTVLVNGLPVVHIELKRRGVALREAFNQIKRYNRDGFWAGDALFEWVQVFVIEKLSQDVKELVARFGMDEEKTYGFITNALSVGDLATTGDDFDRILPAMSLFADEDSAAAFEAKKREIAEALQAMFEEYKGVYVDLVDAYSVTPAELWKSGKQGVPSPLPPGKPAYLVLETEWYDAVETGEKRIEFRDISQKYIAMFRDKHPKCVRFNYGYTTRQMIWEIERIDEDWYFEIHLGKRLQ